ncbi:MAG: hypothetical protein IPK34_09190 [Ramlibacter sp.]|jgi:hypothetical protein|nr:hypothetical protein [Ramlibacter sp.]
MSRALRIDPTRLLGVRIAVNAPETNPNSNSDLAPRQALGHKIGEKPPAPQSAVLGSKVGNKNNVSGSVLLSGKVGGKPTIAKACMGAKIGTKNTQAR